MTSEAYGDIQASASTARDPGLRQTRTRAERARQARPAAQNTFEHVARDWHRIMINWQPQTAQDSLRNKELAGIEAWRVEP